MAWTQPRIQELALIGDCRSAALVDRAGDVVWLCWPRFDSDALFAALIDDERRGHWRLRPEGEWRVERRYLPDTNVLETRFVREGAEVTLLDQMSVAGEDDQRRLPLPEHELLRRVECVRGEVALELELVLAPCFGRHPARVHAHPRLGLRCEAPEGVFLFRGETELAEVPGHPGMFGARFTLRAGEARRFSLSYSAEAPAVLAALGDHADDAIRRTIHWWRAWSSRCIYHGPYHQTVMRSALALKLLCYAPSGAILAAATASLPERLGGDLNWDYRYCWLRDAAFTARVLYGLGYPDEAEAFIDWLLHITRLSQPGLQVMFNVFGQPSAREHTLEGARGYRDSRPVRLGNAAARQRQLDLHGELVDAVYAYCKRGGRLDPDVEALLRGIGDFVVRSWSLPDQGIWEVRSPPQPHTHYRVLCWTALDRLLELEQRGRFRRVRLDVATLARARDAIRESVWTEGFDAASGSYVEVLGGREPDAALLLLPWYAFERADSPRMRGTFRRLVERLGAPHGLFFRNPVLRAQGDGAFVACGFWAAELLADGGGPLELARAWFEQLLHCCNDVGLMSEELDPETGDAIGNFPQAYSHVGLISAALALEQRARREHVRDVHGHAYEEDWERERAREEAAPVNVGSWMLWGFVATVVLTAGLQATQELRLTRVNIPFLLGSIFTPERSRAKTLGTLLHLANGWVFSLLYVAVFQAWGKAGLWRGMLIGSVHAAFVLMAGLPALPGIHPRMAHDSWGPTARRQLEPPGYLGLHYGPLTPLTVLAAHLLYGAILGAFYRLR